MTKNDELIQIWLEDGYAIRDGYQKNIREEGIDSSKSIGERADARDLSFFERLTNGLRFNDSVSVLDIGCGKGEFISFFLKRYPHTRLEPYLGIDIVPEFLDLAQRKYPEFELKQENFLGPDFGRGEKFELVIASGFLPNMLPLILLQTSFQIHRTMNIPTRSDIQHQYRLMR